MPERISQGDVNVGNSVFAWNITEYDQFERPLRWYVLTGAVGILLLAFSVITANYLFALIIVLFGIILFLHDIQTPLQLSFVLTDAGVVIGDKFYRYSELKGFWILYQPPEVKNLYFSLGGMLKHRIQIPLLDNDPRPIRAHLTQYLTEDLEQEEEPLSDRFARQFRI